MTGSKAEKQEKMLSAITRMHRTIGENLALERFALTVLEELITIVNCSGCAILLIEEERISILAEKNFSKKYGEKDLGIYTPMTKYIEDTKQSMHTGEITQSPVADCVPAGSSINSVICMPIMVDEEVRGLIHLDSTEKNAFDSGDLRFVELIAKGISIALERLFLHSQVEVLSTADDLTGCLKRSKLNEDLDAEVARAKRYERPLSLLMIDIDWFKNYNKVHGNPKGDELLKKIAGIFTRSVRDTDKVYRYGEADFSVLLPETTKENALVVARRLQGLIEHEQFEGEKESQPNKKITVSVGVASFPWDGNNKDQLLKSADAALSQAKKSGRNCVYDLIGASSSSS